MTTYTSEETGRQIRTQSPWGTVHTVVLRYAETSDWDVILDGIDVAQPTAQQWIRKLGLSRTKSEAKQLFHAERADLPYDEMHTEALRLRRRRALRTGEIVDLLEAAFDHRLASSTVIGWLRDAGLGYTATSNQTRRCRREAGRLGAERRWNRGAHTIPEGCSRRTSKRRRLARRRSLRRRRLREREKQAYEMTPSQKEVAAEEARLVASSMARRYRDADLEAAFVATAYLAVDADAFRFPSYRDRFSWRSFAQHKAWAAITAEMRRRSASREFSGTESTHLALDLFFRVEDTEAVYADI